MKAEKDTVFEIDPIYNYGLEMAIEDGFMYIIYEDICMIYIITYEAIDYLRNIWKNEIKKDPKILRERLIKLFDEKIEDLIKNEDNIAFFKFENEEFFISETLYKDKTTFIIGLAYEY